MGTENRFRFLILFFRFLIFAQCWNFKPFEGTTNDVVALLKLS